VSILKVDKTDTGNLFYYTAGDPFVILTAGTTYFQTGLGNTAFYNPGIADTGLVIAGNLVALGVGYIGYGTGTTTIAVTSTGYAYANQFLVSLQGPGRLSLTNSGEIDGSINVDRTSTTGSTVINSGKLTGTLYLSDAGDRVENYGLLIGDINTYGGDDTIDTHLGRTSGNLWGGDGNDTYIIAGSERVTEYELGGTDTVMSYANYRLVANVENLTLLGDAKVGYGNAGDNTLTGNDNGNILVGFAGDDNIIGGYGTDNLNGGDGNDTISAGGGGIDTLSGGNGNDLLLSDASGGMVVGGAGDDILGALGESAYLLNGGAGNDVVYFLYNDTAIIGNIATQTVTGGMAGDDTLLSVEGLAGGAYNDSLTGNGGDNQFYGVGGNDTLVGAGGNDSLDGGAGVDRLDGGDGLDTAEYQTASAGVSASLTAGKGQSGDALNDLFVSIENLTGSSYADTLIGDTGANVLSGSYGNDSLNGSQGDDMLIGGAGNDTLVGGSGADVFGFADPVMETAGGFGSDVITLFTNGQDKMSFVGTSVHSLADLTVTQSGADTIITDAFGDQIRIQSFQKTLIDPTDFIFG